MHEYATRNRIREILEQLLRRAHPPGIVLCSETNPAYWLASHAAFEETDGERQTTEDELARFASLLAGFSIVRPKPEGQKQPAGRIQRHIAEECHAHPALWDIPEQMISMVESGALDHASDREIIEAVTIHAEGRGVSAAVECQHT